MRKFSSLVALIVFASPSIAYFKYRRPVQFSGHGQGYIAVDETLWKHARADLADLRLYAGERETPYSLITERGSLQHQRQQVPVLQQSTVAGKTQFLIEMSGLSEYDQVDLKLATRNFIAHARVEGQDDPHGKRWASLGDSILYDLSRDRLGSNHMLRLPRTKYKYLRVTVDGPVKPEEVQGAAAELREQSPAQWRDVSPTPTKEQKGKDTVFSFELPEKVPTERVRFFVDAAQSNFWRKVEIQDGKGAWLGSGEISRIHMVRNGQKIDSEDQDVDFSDAEPKTEKKLIRVIVRNGDDPPPMLTGARLQQLERRLYLEVPAQTSLALYYGDEKLEPPVYDYARLFQGDPAAAAAQLGNELPNPAYTGRPDDRAWSERHPALLWMAIIAAVVALGGVALRSLRTAAA